MSGALIILFPPSPPSGWECPTAEYVLSRLTMLIELGFELNDKSIVDILLIFENKLEEYGDIFWNVFTTIRSNDSNVSLVSRLFKEAFKPSRGLKRILMLGYLKNKSEYAEEILQKIIEETFITEKVEDVDFIGRRKSLILSPTIYQFIIYEYGNESKISSTCFIDILSLKLYLNHTKNPPVSKFTLNSINTTYELYKQGIKYKVENLRHLKAFSRTSIEKLLSNLNG
ncbi:19200_t:CDS:1 [Funneliformis geosporum]|nr:19200_t:CDS:1 [Funneliformis geosporum]